MRQTDAVVSLRILCAAWLLCVFAGVPAVGVAADEARPAPAVSRDLLRDYVADHGTFTLVDARSPAEYAAAHVEGAVNIPYDDLAAHAASLPADRDALIVIYCRTGRRASLLAEQLLGAGFSDVRVLGSDQLTVSETDARFNLED